jgi:hypothetical protein
MKKPNINEAEFWRVYRELSEMSDSELAAFVPVLTHEIFKSNWSVREFCGQLIGEAKNRKEVIDAFATIIISLSIRDWRTKRYVQ